MFSTTWNRRYVVQAIGIRSRGASFPVTCQANIRQNNDLRKTLRRFEKEKQKQMKSIDGDIWELQKFMQELQCVTAVSAEGILPSQQRTPADHRLAATRDKTRKSQNEKFTSLGNESLLSSAPSVSIDVQRVGNDQAKNGELLIGNSNQQRNVWRYQEGRRSSSVGEMCSGTLERLQGVAGYKQALRHQRRSLDVGRQPLLNRRRSLDAGRQPQLHRRRSLDAGKGTGIKMSSEHNNGNPIEPFVREKISGNAFYVNEHPKPPVNKIDIISDHLSFEYGKFNTLQRAPSWRSVFYQRPPSAVMEEAIIEASSENLTVSDKTFSRPSPPSTNSTSETSNRKGGAGLLLRRSAGKLVMRRSSLGTRQLDVSNIITNERTTLTRRSYPFCEKDKLRWQEAPGYKENTSSRLWKQNSRDSAIVLTSKEKNKSFRTIGFVPKDGVNRRNKCLMQNS